ncbi:Atxe2 family lasso peptide isopeptidase [Luteimonas sp. XNQY3]|nr:Atxe2 family lasso peptide isopeptidase [Luteimonas sp. XNQY3]MCD9007024.1 Atxe2 family lasso peptide isopeptidase [Luteimonas sp. XNQY3]
MTVNGLWSCAPNRLSKVALAGVLALLSSAFPASAESISPRRLLEVVDFGPPVVSPDGRRVAFRVEQASIERNTYDTVWYVQSIDGDTVPRRVADGGPTLRDHVGTTLPTPAIWSPDGRWIYYRALMDGVVDVWRAAADGSGAEPLSLDAADVRDFSLSDDGLALAYSVGLTREEVAAAEQAEYDLGVRIDGSVPIGQGLFRSANNEGRLATQRYRGVWFQRAPLLAGVPDRWKSIRLDTRVVEALSPTEAPPPGPTAADLSDVSPSPWKIAHEKGGGRIALLSRAGEDRGLLQKPDIELAMLPSGRSRHVRTCLDALCVGKSIDRIQWLPGRDEVLFTVTDPDDALAQSMFRWNVETGAVLPVLRSGGLVSGGRDPSSHCGVSIRVLVCVMADADRPPHLAWIDIETGRSGPLFDPNADLAGDLRGVPVRTLRWKDALGRTFTGKFYPATAERERPSPLFVTHYSCAGFVRGGVGDEWPLVSLSQQGIAALCINQLPDYVLDPVERTGQGMAAVRSVVDQLASEGEIDRERVGMGGLSFGSSLTLWAATESDLLAAASVASNDVSYMYYLVNSLRGDTFLSVLKELWGLGAPEETPDQWNAVSTALKVDRITAPILFQQSEQEYITGLDLTIPLLRGHRADLYVFPNEPHVKFQPRHLLAVNERNLDWFRFWLLGIESSSTGRQAEYAHWRTIRKAFRADASHARSGHDMVD